MTKNTRKEKLEIKIDSEEAIENFGSEIFDQNIVLFVDEGYNHFKEGIKKAQEDQDKAKMKMLTHTLKTTARYMASENFAMQCHSIESETKDPNWDKINQLLPDFFEYLDTLYNECLKFYNDIKGIKKPEEDKVEIQENNEVFEHNQNNNLTENLQQSKNILKSSKTCNEEDTKFLLENENDSIFKNTFSSKNIISDKNQKIEKGNLSNSFISKPNNILTDGENLRKVSNIAQRSGVYKNVQLINDKLSPHHDTMDKTEKYSNLLSKDKEAITHMTLNGKNLKNSSTFNLGVSTPQISASNFEVNKIKIDYSGSENLSIKNIDDDLSKKKVELSHSNSTSNLNLNLKNPKNCIKSLRDIDKPTTTGSYFKPKLDDKPKIPATNSEFKKIFVIDSQKIKILKPEFKEKLRNFSEDEIFKLMTRLRKIVEAEYLDKKDLLNFFKELKLQLKIINVSYICERIDGWIEQINDIPSLNKYKLTWSDFDSLFIKLNDDVNSHLENIAPEMNPPQTKKTTIDKDLSMILYDQQNLGSSDNIRELLRSPMLNAKLNLSLNGNFNVKNFHENTLKELKPIYIESLFKNGRSPEEISNSIKKLLEDCNEKSKVCENKSNMKLARQTIPPSIQDFSYPFKQDNFSCTIL